MVLVSVSANLTDNDARETGLYTRDPQEQMTQVA